LDASTHLPPASGPLSAVAEEALIQVFERAPLAFFGMDGEGRILHANQGFLDSLGMTLEDLPGLSFPSLRQDLEPAEARAWFLQAFERPGEARALGNWQRKDGSILPVRLSVVGQRTATGDRLFVWGRDYSEEQQVTDRLREGAQLQRHLAEGIYALGLTRTQEEVFRVLLNRAAAVIKGAHWFLGRTGSKGGRRRLAFMGWQPTLAAHIGPDLQAFGLPILDTGFAQEVFDQRRLCYVADVSAAPHMVHPSTTSTWGLQSLLGVPLVFEGRVMGVLFAVGFQHETPIDPQEGQFEVLQSLARIAALAMERFQAESRLEDAAGLARDLAAGVKELAGAVDEEAMVAALFRWAARLVPLPEWWFNRYDAVTGNTLTTTWTPGLEAFGTPEDIRRPVPVVGNPLLEGMHLSLKGIHIPRCEGHPDLPDPEIWPYRTFIGMPMVHEGKVVGTLSGGSFGSQGHVAVSTDRLGALESLAEAAGLVLERLYASRALEAERAQFHLLFDRSPDPILLLAETNILDVNAAAQALFGLPREAMLGRSMQTFCPERQPGGALSMEGCREHMEDAFAGRPLSFEWTFLCADGREAPCQVNLTRLEQGEQPILHVIVRDLSAQKAAEAERATLERQLFQAQKMESLGVLAGGIAHDFNNLLMGVLGHAGLGLEQLNPLHPVRRNLESIQRAGQRAADLTRQMLAYSGRGQFVVRNLDLTSQVEEMLHLLEVSLPKAVALKLDLHRSLPAISADASQLQQVIMNLVINAAEAIGDGSGVIRLSTGVERLDAAAMAKMLVGGEATPGAYVSLEVVDTGCGMDADTLGRIFEPFFSTKFTGRGLGLSAIMGIVRGHKGALQVASVPGEGTTFKVLFPAQGITADPLTIPALEVVWAGKGLILVVDDDETVRAVARQALELKGFQVLDAQDGRRAIELVREHGQAIGVVLLDMTMPRMGGQEAFQELRRLQPALKVILSSGYDEGEAMGHFRGKGMNAFIQKPYGPRELLAKIQGVLEA